MKLKEFLERYNHSPLMIEEVANLAKGVEDDHRLSETAKNFETWYSAMEIELRRIGFEFG